MEIKLYKGNHEVNNVTQIVYGTIIKHSNKLYIVPYPVQCSKKQCNDFISVHAYKVIDVEEVFLDSNGKLAQVECDSNDDNILNPCWICPNFLFPVGCMKGEDSL